MVEKPVVQRLEPLEVADTLLVRRDPVPAVA